MEWLCGSVTIDALSLLAPFVGLISFFETTSHSNAVDDHCEYHCVSVFGVGKLIITFPDTGQ